MQRDAPMPGAPKFAPGVSNTSAISWNLLTIIRTPCWKVAVVSRKPRLSEDGSLFGDPPARAQARQTGRARKLAAATLQGSVHDATPGQIAGQRAPDFAPLDSWRPFVPDVGTTLPLPREEKNREKEEEKN